MIILIALALLELVLAGLSVMQFITTGNVGWLWPAILGALAAVSIVVMYIKLLR